MHDGEKVCRFFLAVMLGVFLVSLMSVEVLLVNDSYAQDDLFIYPKEGQSDEQLEKDKYDCYQWSKKETGFDPMQPPTATEPPPQKQPKKRSGLRGAAGGALLGAAIGEIADDDAGKGAAIGAATGAVFGGMKRRKQVASEEQAEQQWAQEQANIYAQKRNAYNRAYSACLEARGYTVK